MALLAGGAAAALTGGPARAGEDFSDIDAFFARAQGDIGGGGALVLYHGEERAYAKGFGEVAAVGRIRAGKASGAWTPDTVVPIASASKWISGGVLMSVVEEGLLSLDDTAGEFLPEFTGDKAKITIRQMFSHTHGFPEGPQVHRDTTITMKEAVSRIAGMTLEHEPGTALHYSGIGMQVAGYICTLVTKKPWVELFRERIGDPLGMANTDYFAFGKTENPNVAGSIQTSAEEYGRFTRMVLGKGVLDGRRVLKDETVRIMTTNQTGDLPIARHPWGPLEKESPEMAHARYGIGVWLEKMDADGHAIEMSSGGAFGCQPFVDYGRSNAGCFMPFSREMRQVGQGLAINAAAIRYLELEELIHAHYPPAP